MSHRRRRYATRSARRELRLSRVTSSSLFYVVASFIQPTSPCPAHCVSKVHAAPRKRVKTFGERAKRQSQAASPIPSRLSSVSTRKYTLAHHFRILLPNISILCELLNGTTLHFPLRQLALRGYLPVAQRRLPILSDLFLILWTREERIEIVFGARLSSRAFKCHHRQCPANPYAVVSGSFVAARIAFVANLLSLPRSRFSNTIVHSSSQRVVFVTAFKMP